jgi:hypothetical protein
VVAAVIKAARGVIEKASGNGEPMPPSITVAILAKI